MSRTSRAHPVSVARRSYLLEIGDVVQMDNKDRHGNKVPDGVWDHTMIVTGKKGSELLMSYHSKNTRNDPLSSIRARNPNARFIGWHIHDNY